MDALTLTQELVAFDSVSSRSNAAVADFGESLLRELGCRIERTEYENPAGVRKVNVIGKLGEGRGGLAYFGHLDVVPAENWARAAGPFEPKVDGDRLYGRGSCDMKGSVACFVAATARLLSELQQAARQPLYIALTADEEIGMRGAQHIAGHSQMFREMVEADTPAIIGEPTRLQVVYAHKGGAGFQVTATGRAAHSSTERGINANWAMLPFLAEMQALYEETKADPAWLNEEFDPPHISFNLSVNDYNPAMNITPAQSICRVMFRPMPGQDANVLLDRVRRLAEARGLKYEELLNSAPVYLDPDSPFVRSALELTETSQARTVSYGTDGGRLTELRQMIILGPGDIAQAHTADEWIELEQLDAGVRVFERFIRRYCLGSES